MFSHGFLSLSKVILPPCFPLFLAGHNTRMHARSRTYIYIQPFYKFLLCLSIVIFYIFQIKIPKILTPVYIKFYPSYFEFHYTDTFSFIKSASIKILFVFICIFYFPSIFHIFLPVHNILLQILKTIIILVI